MVFFGGCITYSYFSSHPPILLLLLSAVKMGVSILFIAPSVWLGAAYTDSETANDNGGVFHEKNKRLLAFTTLLTFINTVSMVTPLWNCLLFCDRWIHGFFLEGTCFNQSESQTGSHDVSNKHDFSFQHLFFFIAITPTPSVHPSN